MDDNSLGFMEWFRSMRVVPRFLRVQSTKINLIAFVLAQTVHDLAFTAKLRG